MLYLQVTLITLKGSCSIEIINLRIRKDAV